MSHSHQCLRFAGYTAPLYLCLLWLVASLFRTGGMEVFLGGLAALVLGFLAFSRGRRKPLFLLYLTVMLLAGCVGLMELFLRIAPNSLHGMSANYAFGRFHAYAGGIYEKDPHTAKRIRPNQVCDMYFNGFHWTHDANSAGYRGPLLHETDAVFLGDSLIYGHGVETNEAVPHRYELHAQQATANLGVQGTGFIQEWMQFQRLGLQLKPKLVFLCSHPNDLGDVSQYYDNPEVEKFLASSVDDTTEPLARSRFRPQPFWHPRTIWEEYLALPLRSAGAIRVLGQGMKQGFSKLSGPVASTPALEYRSPKSQWQLDSEADRLAWKAHCHALAKIQHGCDTIGARLIVFDLGFPEGFSAAMESECVRTGIDYSRAGRVALQQALAGEDIYLPADGHWSPHGCDVIGQELAKDQREIAFRANGAAK
jgi:hypothetical protein